jgi:hypothetical protein
MLIIGTFPRAMFTLSFNLLINLEAFIHTITVTARLSACLVLDGLSGTNFVENSSGAALTFDFLSTWGEFILLSAG